MGAVPVPVAAKVVIFFIVGIVMLVLVVVAVLMRIDGSSREEDRPPAPLSVSALMIRPPSILAPGVTGMGRLPGC